MRALKYFLSEAASSLWRGRASAIFAVLTIAAGLFVLGFFLVVNANVQRVAARWGEAAEMSVFLKDDASAADLKMVDELVGGSGLAAEREYVSKADALARFRQEFPDLAPATARLERNPFPASFEVRLRPEAQRAGEAVDGLAATLSGVGGVAEVRYDRRWLSRLNAAIRFVGGIGALIVTMLALAAALTVANVVRLAAYARRDEIEIMQLVGAPLAYVRGPFIAEGVLQGGIGALLAIVTLAVVFTTARARYGSMAAEALGLGAITFLPIELCLLLVGGGMLLGCLGGLVVARGVR
ncbi:MAG TPA: ABC transporter permease [Vicinamibacterales bacterium]|jgi:cell division transport system permease protein|nr:ABC transporter permease [Vicinamibacterales bacterium]